MKNVEKRNNLTILTTDTGLVSNKDKTSVFDTPIYLGKFDSVDNYIEITEKEKELILAEQEELRKLEMEKGGVTNE